MKVHLLELGRFSAAFLASMTMVFSPVAMGRQAEAANKQMVTEKIRYYGMNKPQTVHQFWQKIKAEVPGPLYRDIENFVKNNKNVKMPRMEVKEVAATDGSRVPSLTIDQNGKMTTVQFYGEKKKFVTINGKAISEIEFKRDLGKAMGARKSANATAANPYTKDFARFEGFPRITPVLWKSMTREQRANYIVKMRLMWQSARKVIATTPAGTSRAAPQKKKDAALIENFYRIILGQPAEAQGNPQFTGPNCVVAGYIGRYTAPITNDRGVREGGGCTVTAAIADARYSSGDLSFVGRDNATCASQGQNFVACNPVVYGYQRADSGAGQPICVDRMSPQFQQATHFPGPCDTASRLSTSEDVVSPNADYSSPNRAARIAAIEADQRQQDFNLTKEYLSSVLKNRQNKTLQEILDGQWSKTIDDEIVQIQEQFEREIELAMTTCAQSMGQGTHERNQRAACDQLHRRWLFTERVISEYRQKACDPSTTYIGKYDNREESGYSASGDATEKTVLNKRRIDESGTNLCRCEDQRLVNFGQTCGAVQPPVPPVSSDPTPAVCARPELSGLPVDANCKCPDGDDPEEEDGRWTCDDDGGGFPWLLVGGIAAVGAACLLWFCKGDDDDDPPVLCPNRQPAPNGDIAQCPVFCNNGQPAPGNDITKCSACPDGTLPPGGNMAMCPVKCPDGSNPPGNNVANCPVKCPDGSVAPGNDVTKCPTPPTKCPDGSNAPGGNVANCPVKCPDGSAAPGNDVTKCPVKCPDGTTAPGNNPANCPVTCPDGTPAPNNNIAACVPRCPVGRTGTPPNCVCANTCGAGTVINPTSCSCDAIPSEGGGGNNCPNGNCNGGVPTGGTGN